MPNPNCIHIGKTHGQSQDQILPKSMQLPTIFCRPEKTKSGQC
jgi:hypothetical protein